MPTHTLTQSPESFRTLSPSGKAPKSRIPSASVAQTKFMLWKDAAKGRHEKAAVINGMFDGNPPFRRDKRRQAGQDWMANFNTLEGASRKDAAKAPYYDIFASTKTYFEAHTTKDNPDGADADKASRIITDEFDKLLKAWPAFDLNVWMMLDDFIKFNKGFFWWPRVDSWRFRVVPWHRIYFPEGYSVDIDEWEEFAIEHEFAITKLWEFVEDERAARAAGWNRDMVIDAIRHAVPEWHEDDPIETQRKLKESVYEPNALKATVHAASLFVKEFDGSWSRMMVPVFQDGEESVSNSNPTSRIDRAIQKGRENDSLPKLSDNDYLYFKQEVGADLTEILVTFFFEVHDGSLNALEGLGKKITPLMQAKDRICCGIADNTIMRQRVILQQKTASSVIKGGLVRVGSMIATIPPGFEAVTAQLFGDIEGSIAVNADFDRRLDANTGIYRPSFEKPQGNPESATAASLRFGQATVLSNSAVNRFESQLDRMGQELFRRATLENLPTTKDPGIRAAKRFQKALSDRGVSRAQLEEIVEDRLVLAVRAIGNGSPVMRQQMVQSLAPVSAYMGQRGLANWLDDYVAAFGGQTKVDRYFPDSDRSEEPSQDDWEATRENNDMQQGAPPLLTGEQNHEIHAMRHLQAGIQAVQAVEQGADPSIAFTFLQLAIPHIAEHAAKIPREDRRKMIEQGLKQLEQAAGQIQKMLQDQARQQQEASRLSFEQQMKAQDLQADIARKDAKNQHQMSTKQSQAEHAQAVADAKTAAEIRRKDVQTAAEIQRQTAAAAATERNGDGE